MLLSEKGDALSVNWKGLVTQTVVGLAVGATDAAIGDRTPASVAQRNSEIVGGSAFVLGVAGKALSRSAFGMRGSDALVASGAAILGRPLTQLVDANYVMKTATTASTTTAPTQLVRANVQRVAAAPVYRVQDDLADSFTGTGL